MNSGVKKKHRQRGTYRVMPDEKGRLLSQKVTQTIHDLWKKHGRDMVSKRRDEQKKMGYWSCGHLAVE
jgi:hypothetical protein